MAEITGQATPSQVAHDSTAGNKEVVQAGTIVPPAENMTTDEMEHYLKGKEDQIAEVVDKMLCLLDTCLSVEPPFEVMRRSIETLNRVYLACRQVWRLTAKWEEGKKEENGDFMERILPYKQKIGASFRVMCHKLHEKVEKFVSKAQGNVEQELFYLMIQSNSMLYFAEFSDERSGEAEKAKTTAKEAKRIAQAKADGIPDGSCAIMPLFLFNDAFIKYELEHSTQEALSAAGKGCTMQIPCCSSTEREKYEDMIESLKEAIKCWTPSMIEELMYYCNPLPPLFTNSTEMIRIQPTVEQRKGVIVEPAARHLADIESQVPKPPSREIRFKKVLYASLQGFALVASFLFTKTKVFAEYTQYFPDFIHKVTLAYPEFAPKIPGVCYCLSVLVPCLAFVLHVWITKIFVFWKMPVSWKENSTFSIIAKIRNNILGSAVVIGSVVIGCIFQRQELKEFYLMLVFFFMSIYAMIFTYLVFPGVDFGLPDAFASLALHICWYLRPTWWFMGLCCYCICVQVYKYVFMG